MSSPTFSLLRASTRRRAPLVLALAASLLVTACSTRLDTRPPSGVNLSGDWVLDRQQSDVPARLIASKLRRAETREPAREEDGDGGRDQPPQAGESRPPRGQTDDRDDRQGESRRERDGSDREAPAAVRTFFVQAAKLSIEQLPQEIKVVADGVPDDYGYGDEVLESVGADLVQRRTGWHDGAFVVDYGAADGVSATRRYACAAGCERLTVTTRLSGGRFGGMTLHSTYRRAKPGDDGG